MINWFGSFWLSLAGCADKLPLEQEQFEALERMRILAPYYRWTFSLCQRHTGRRVLDAGCGTGKFAENAKYVLAVAKNRDGIPTSLSSKHNCANDSLDGTDG